MNNDVKIWQTMFKLNNTRCACGNDLKILSVKKAQR
jgi:hypothetical protein